MIVIPPERLEKDILQAVVESYIAREGTDYGFHEMTMEAKVNQVLAMLKKQHVFLCYDEASESINIVTKDELQQWGDTDV